jgi:DNA replication protein DnaC
VFSLTDVPGEVFINKAANNDEGNTTLNTTLDEQKGSEAKLFTFDHAYDDTSTQLQIYNECVKNIIQNVMEGYNGTIFAYGQTGTGKTHTMSGDADDFHEKGIMPRAFEDIMDNVREIKAEENS